MTWITVSTSLNYHPKLLRCWTLVFAPKRTKEVANKTLVRPDQKYASPIWNPYSQINPLQKQSDLCLPCFSRPFSQATGVHNVRTFTVSFFYFSGLKADLVERLHKYYKEVCLTLYAQMDSSFWFHTINLGWPIVY